jgi:hypothetical protein
MMDNIPAIFDLITETGGTVTKPERISLLLEVIG